MPAHNLDFEALGTHWRIDLPIPATAVLQHDLHTLLTSIDHTWSRFKDDSYLNQMARAAGHYPLEPQDRALIEWYDTLYQATDGKVTPLVGQTLVDAGYDRTYSLQPKTTITQAPAWDDIIRLTATGITIHTPWQLDVGAAGKGYAVDRVADLLASHHIEQYTVDAGGDLFIQARPETIGLEHPHDTTKLIGTYTTDYGGFCGSASNRRSWGSWHHIIDPRSTRPTSDVLATWVYADTAMIADGLATALFFTPADNLAKLARFDYVLVRHNGVVEYSDSPALQLFTETPA